MISLFCYKKLHCRTCSYIHQCFEENRARHKGGGGLGRPISRNSDWMSLSSLSSGDNNILEQGPQQGPPPPTGGPHYPPPGYPGFPPHPGGPPPPHGWPPPMAGYPPGYPPPPGHQMHGGWHHLGPGPYGHHPGKRQSTSIGKDAQQNLL